MKTEKIGIPAGLDFSSLNLSRDTHGNVHFDWEPIEKICAASGIDIALFRDQPEDNLAALISRWYDDHIAAGGERNSVADALIAEVIAEDYSTAINNPGAGNLQ